MKTQILTAIVLAGGMLMATAQSNPSSTNGVDTEMELPWPDGTVYESSYNAVDYFMDTNLPWADALWNNDNYNWSAAGGGSGYYSIVYPDGQYASFTNAYTWPGSSWPVWNYGESISLPGPSGTNFESLPPGASFSPQAGFYLGSVNYDDFSDGGEEVFQYNNQPQITLITGGASGTTGTELFGISASAENDLPNQYAIPLQQISISSFGSLNTNGQAFAVLPLHTQVPITPNASGAGYYEINLNAQPYQLVSQCVATTPANQARTTIGVGEQVNLSFSPTLPINAVWRTTAGSLSSLTNTSTQLTAPNSAGSATVTATVQGQSVSIPFNVVAPSAYARAQIVTTNNSYGTGNAGAGMLIEIWIGPTNVSFGAVSIMEVGEIATNATGYFANTNTWPAGNLNHSLHGANEWVQLGEDNSVGPDDADSGTCIPPWSAGNFTWPIPVDWEVGNGPTNSMTGWSQNFIIDASGTVTVQKFGHSVTRTVNNVVTTQ